MTDFIEWAMRSEREKKKLPGNTTTHLRLIISQLK